MIFLKIHYNEISSHKDLIGYRGMSNQSPDIIPDQFKGGTAQSKGNNGSLLSDPETHDAVMKLKDISNNPNLTHYEKQNMVFELIKACPKVSNYLEFIERSKSARNHLIQDRDDTKRDLDGIECKLKNTCISSNKE